MKKIWTFRLYEDAFVWDILFFSLFLVLLILKLCGVTAVAGWSWWWITAPLWAPFAVSFGLIYLGLIFGGICLLVNLLKLMKKYYG